MYSMNPYPPASFVYKRHIQPGGISGFIFSVNFTVKVIIIDCQSKQTVKYNLLLIRCKKAKNVARLWLNFSGSYGHICITYQIRKIVRLLFLDQFLCIGFPVLYHPHEIDTRRQSTYRYMVHRLVGHESPEHCRRTP